MVFLGFMLMTASEAEMIVMPKIIQKLRDTYNFGSYDEGEVTFTGKRFRQ